MHYKNGIHFQGMGYLNSIFLHENISRSLAGYPANPFIWVSPCTDEMIEIPDAFYLLDESKTNTRSNRGKNDLKRATAQKDSTAAEKINSQLPFSKTELKSPRTSILEFRVTAH
jgi:hypothetical protein